MQNHVLKRMNKLATQSFHILALCLALALCFSSEAALAQAQEPHSTLPGSATQVNAVLDRWASALGGRERLQTVRTIYTRSAVETGGLKGTMQTWSDSAGRHKEIADFGNLLRETTVFDGARGWNRNTNGKVHELAGTDLEEQVTEAYLASYSQFL